MKVLFSSAVALAALLALPALAANTNPSTDSSAGSSTDSSAGSVATAPATKVPDTTAATTAPTTATPPTTSTTSPPAEIVFLHVQQSNQLLASRVVGAYVVNDAGETVGSVNDIVFDKDGKIAHKNSNVKPAQVSKEILEVVEKLQK